MSDSVVGAYERSDVGLYVLGALDARRNRPFERHLALCDECLSEAGVLADVAVAFVLLPAEECRLILRELAGSRPGSTGDTPWS